VTLSISDVHSIFTNSLTELTSTFLKLIVEFSYRFPYQFVQTRLYSMCKYLFA